VSARVIGVGSPFGDDRVGWDVVAALEAALRTGPTRRSAVDTRICDRPGAALVGMLAGVEHAVIVDAARAAGLAPGSLCWLAEHEIEAESAASSHGFGLAHALALARVLGDAPGRVDVLAIGAARFEGESLSDALRAAVPLAVRGVLARIDSEGACVDIRGGCTGARGARFNGLGAQRRTHD
jgi:hydrogenase maturation protease